MTRTRRRYRARRRSRSRRHGGAGWVLLAVLAVIAAGIYGAARIAPRRRVARLEQATILDTVEQALLPVGYARSGERLEDIRGIVIHYVGNPGTSAINNRNYFAQETTEVCSHFVVGLKGEVVQCLPLWERSAASNQRNRDTISIEVCHPDDSGKIREDTYASLVQLTAWLCRTADLTPEQVIRHYDVTGKECPRYFVRHPDAWTAFLEDVRTAL